MIFLLDTHVWLWAQIQPEKLSPRVAALIASGKATPCISPVTLYETLVLAERGRIRIETPAANWISASLARKPMRMLDVTSAIALGARDLPGYDNQDPFDRILLATARVHQLPIVTRDESMTRWDGVAVLW